VSFDVRQAALSQASEIAGLAARTFALACPSTASPADISAFIDTHLTAQRLADYIADPQRHVAIAAAEGQPIGFTLLNFEPPVDDVARQLTTASTAELSKIYVDPTHHGSAVAQALLDDAATRAREAGFAAVWLGTNQANERAQRFYEKNGFTRVGARRFLLGSEWQDDFIYERVF
jgi:ribosomal protein S18 acetylase RimI-like enzyme